MGSLVRLQRLLSLLLRHSPDGRGRALSRGLVHALSGTASHPHAGGALVESHGLADAGRVYPADRHCLVVDGSTDGLVVALDRVEHLGVVPVPEAVSAVSC